MTVAINGGANLDKGTPKLGPKNSAAQRYWEPVGGMRFTLLL